MTYMIENRLCFSNNRYAHMYIRISARIRTEFDSERIAESDEIVLANTIDGETLPEQYWSQRIVGFDVNKAEMLRNVIEICLIFEIN
jgi:hypothetical protein